MKIQLLLLFFIVQTVLNAQNFRINIPENIDIKEIPENWKGHNISAKNQVDLINTSDFDEAFTRIFPGIMRWPGGNSSNNYQWRKELNNNNILNLKNFNNFLTTYNIKGQFVINFGNGNSQAAAEFVRFCNNTTPYYNNLRNELIGNSNPLEIKYWEIGNENASAWSFENSWLGFQENIYFRTGTPPTPLNQNTIDSLYYYGGDFYRKGWVEKIGGLTNETAVLGELKQYSSTKAKDTIAVKFPKLDVNDLESVKVYLTRNFDFNWAKNVATQQQLYDSITKPSSLLLSTEYSWDDSRVFLNPNQEFLTSDLILIEYNSINHDGAFLFRDSMKVADPNIKIGFNVIPKGALISSSSFQEDFKNSQPDFLIKHPYASGLTIPPLNQQKYSEAVYASEIKINSLELVQEEWNQKVIDWNLNSPIGFSFSEWNIALYDEAPDTHPIRGITSALYIADFWLRFFTKGLDNSIQVATLNHFALLAIGNNFIHLFHPNTVFSLSPEGIATTMVMENIHRGLFDITSENIPQIQLEAYISGQLQTIDVDAVTVYSGVTDDANFLNLILINRDDENEISVTLNIPNNYEADYIIFESFTGEMINQIVNPITNNQINLSSSEITIHLPSFSLNSVKIHINNPLKTSNYTNNSTPFMYPNPNNGFLFLKNIENIKLLYIYDNLGKKVLSQKNVLNNTIDIQNLSSGIYFLKIQKEDNSIFTFKFIKN